MEENEWMDGKTFTLLTISPPCLFFFFNSDNFCYFPTFHGLLWECNTNSKSYLTTNQELHFYRVLNITYTPLNTANLNGVYSFGAARQHNFNSIHPQ